MIAIQMQKKINDGNNLKPARQVQSQFERLFKASLFTVICAGFSIAHAEGSRNLASNPIGNANIPALAYNTAFTPGGGAAQAPLVPVHYAYANVGDVINMGASNNGVGTGRIEYISPSGIITTCGTTGGVGVIANASQEAAGPLPAAGGYTPCSVNVAAGEAGLWRVNFITSSTAGGANVNRTKTTFPPAAAGDLSIAAWDVTVSSAGANQNGRVFVRYFPGNGNNTSFKFVVLTQDGYQYEWSADNASFGQGGLVADKVGNTNSAGPFVPLYRSFDLQGTNPGVYPVGVGLDLAGRHKMFYGTPDSQLPNSSSSVNGATWLLSQPVTPPVVSSITFTGIEGILNQTGTNPLTGYFSITAAGPTPGFVKIDLNGNGSYTDAIDRILPFIATAAGVTTIPWDGKNGLGVDVVGGTLLQLNVGSDTVSGEVHFPALDFENTTGTRLIRQNGPVAGRDIIYWNDLAIGGTSGLAGVSSTNLAHAVGAIGDTGAIDTWSYILTPGFSSLLDIFLAESDLSVVKTITSANLTPAIGESVTYRIVARNAGPTAATNAAVIDNFHTDATAVAVVSAIASSTGACGTQNIGSNVLTFTGVNLGVNETCTYTVTTAYSSAGYKTNQAAIQRPADNRDPNSTNVNAAAPVNTYAGVQAESNASVAGSGDGASPHTASPIAPTSNNISWVTLQVVGLPPVPKLLDVVKNVGVPVQVPGASPKLRFEIPYTVTVKNNGVTSAPNVQVVDSLTATYGGTNALGIKTPQTAASAVVVSAGTPGTTTCSANTSYTGLTGNIALLTGTDTLTSGASCSVSFIAVVEYPAITSVPVAANNNRAIALASTTAIASTTLSVSGTGAAGADTTALIVPAAVVGVISTDVSNGNSAMIGGINGVTTVTTNVLVPSIVNGDNASSNPTAVTFAVQKVDAVKAAGVPKQVGPKLFEVDYSIVIGNSGLPIVYNVQGDDNLRATYPTASNITISNYQVLNGTGGSPAAATCAANANSFTGTEAGSTKLLSGTTDLRKGQSCVVTFKVTIDFGVTALPSSAQNNTVHASATGQDSATNLGSILTDTGGFTPALNTTTTDASSAGPATVGLPGTLPLTPKLPEIPGTDSPSPTPVTLSLNKVDAVKASGIPKQIGAGKFEIAYDVVVGNKGSTTVYNVQANDNLVATYPAPATFFIKPGSYSATAFGGGCTGNAAYNGNSNTRLLAGIDDWTTNQSCSIKFVVVVDYGVNPAPAVSHNSALASGYGADSLVPNDGFTNITQNILGIPLGTAPTGASTTDISSGAPATTGEPGTPPQTPKLPDAPGQDAPSPSSTPLVSNKIDIVKAAGVPKQIAPKIFEISYSIVIANVCHAAPLTCTTTPAVFNVQANDNLANTFPTATSIVVSNYAVANGAGGAICAAATPAYAGNVAASALLSGVNDLFGGQSCIVSFKATVDFGANAAPTVPQNNLAYASGTAVDTTSNPGFTYAVDGTVLAPINASAIDVSSTAAPATGAPGTPPATPQPPIGAGSDSSLGVPTPVTFVVEEDGELLIKKTTATKETASGEIVTYTINISNTSSNPVRSKVTDTPPIGFEFVAGTAKLDGMSILNPTKVNDSSLMFDIGAIPPKSTVVLSYKMLLGDAIEAGDAANCASASGTNTLTAGEKESEQSCASVVIKTGLFLEKRANVSKAELGDSVEYSLRVKSVGGTTKNVTIFDQLPLGFKLIEGTVRILRAGVVSSGANPAGTPGPNLTFNVGTVGNKEVVEIRYRLRVGIGADLGDGINKAQAKAPYAAPSVIAIAKVLVKRGVFTRDACIAGKVFVDCNQNKVQDKCEDGSKDTCEPGIAGVRLYMEDGTNITTDENGQYSICGIRASSHVMLVDMTTMPIGSRMGITSSENFGSGKSLMLNIKAGQLHRADFIEFSCFPKILDQVEQRRRNSASVVNVPLMQSGKDRHGTVFASEEQELLAPALRGVK